MFFASTFYSAVDLLVTTVCTFTSNMKNASGNLICWVTEKKENYIMQKDMFEKTMRMKIACEACRSR